MMKPLVLLFFLWYVLQVSFADAKAIRIVGVQAKGKEYDSVWTSEWNLVVHGSGNVFSPHRGTLTFPLRLGTIFRSAYEVTQAAKGPSARIKHEVTTTVIGWEDVVVAAGKFRALRVEGRGAYQRLDNPRKGVAQDILWYVPAVKRWVKYERHATNDLGNVEDFLEEQVAFSLQ